LPPRRVSSTSATSSPVGDIAAVAGVVDVLETDLLEQVADNPDHRAVVVDYENRHREINSHVGRAQ
jgi:hypothetical protein